MKVCLYLEFADSPLVRKSGFWTAFTNQRRALEKLGVKVSTNPEGSDYDILHIHSYGPRSFRYLMRAKREGKRVIVHAHSVGRYDLKNSFIFANLIAPFYEYYLHSYYQRADTLFTPSERARELLRAQGLRGRIEVVPNCIEPERLRFEATKREKNRKDLSLSCFTVISAGNVIPRKGILDFIDVATMLPEYDFVWYGQRWGAIGFNPRVEQRLRNRPKNLHMPGFTDDMQAALSGGDLFFFPSYGETQSLVLLEASACGLPLVVRDLPEYETWLVEGENCLKGKNTEEFAALVTQVAADGKLRERLSAAARATADEYSLDKIGQRLVRLYSEILDGKRQAE